MNNDNKLLLVSKIQITEAKFMSMDGLPCPPPPSFPSASVVSLHWASLCFSPFTEPAPASLPSIAPPGGPHNPDPGGRPLTRPDTTCGSAGPPESNSLLPAPGTGHNTPAPARPGFWWPYNTVSGTGKRSMKHRPCSQSLLVT